jgi:hypothetical protein
MKLTVDLKDHQMKADVLVVEMKAVEKEPTDRQESVDIN